MRFRRYSIVISLLLSSLFRSIPKQRTFLTILAMRVFAYSFAATIRYIAAELCSDMYAFKANNRAPAMPARYIQNWARMCLRQSTYENVRNSRYARRQDMQTKFQQS